MRKRYRIFVVVLILTVTAILPAQEAVPTDIGFRNISSVSFLAELDGDVETVIDQVLLINITPAFGTELKIQRKDASNVQTAVESRNESTVFFGPVFVWAPATYSIARYGFGFDSERDFSHAFELETTHEATAAIVSHGVRSVVYPQRGNWFVLPSLGVRILLHPRWTTLIKSFVSLNDRDHSSVAGWTEVSYQALDRLGLKLGATGEHISDSTPSGRSKWSLLTGASFAVRETLSIRYQLEVVNATDDAIGFDNTLVFDATF